MNCRKCKSSKLMAYNYKDFKSIAFQQGRRWILQDMESNYVYYHSNFNYRVICLDCSFEFEIDKLKRVISPKIDNKEIVLDLDQTLFYAIHPIFDKNDKFDFIIKTPDEKEYKIIKRPNLKEFIDFCLIRFEKINFYTSAQDWYANQLIKILNIPDNKIGWIKTFVDTVEKRPIYFEREFVKTMNNCFVVDDNYRCIKGYLNKIFKIKPFFGNKNDQELLNLINFIKNKKEKSFKISEVSDVEVDIFLRNLKINVKNFNLKDFDLVKKMINIMTKEEMCERGYITDPSDYPYIEMSNKTRLVFSDLNYDNYLKLIKMLKIKKNKSQKEYDLSKL